MQVGKLRFRAFILKRKLDPKLLKTIFTFRYLRLLTTEVLASSMSVSILLTEEHVLAQSFYGYFHLKIVSLNVSALTRIYALHLSLLCCDLLHLLSRDMLPSLACFADHFWSF